MNDQQANTLFQQSIALLQQGASHEALKILAKLDQAMPSNPGILYFTATGHSIAGNKHKAIQTYERVLRLHPQFIEAYNNLGLDLAYLGEHQRALIFFDQALVIRPDFFECRLNKGISLAKLGLTTDAINCFEEVLQNQPQNLVAMANLSAAHIHLGDYSSAKNLANKAIAISPKDSKAYQNLGDISLKEERTHDAIEFFKQAYSLNPTDIDIVSGLGFAYQELNFKSEALACFEKALTINPNHGQTYNNLGLMHHELRDFEQAIESFSKPVNDRSRLSNREYNRSLSYLHAGLLREGWRDYKQRWKESDISVPYLLTAKPLWEGQKTDEVVFIWHEQGIGDQILFGTLINEALQIAPNLLVRLDKRLISLFERSFPKIRFISHGEQLGDGDFTYHLPIGDLAQLFRPTLPDFEHQPTSYLQSNSDQVKRLRSNFEVGKPVVGLAWVTKGKRSRERNLPIDELVPEIQQTIPAELIDLQYSDTAEERARIAQSQGVAIHHLDEIDNFSDLDGLASLISACDFVVTCSNSTAHFAGALGKETYLLVPFGRGRHWYWSHIGADDRSLWYPSIHVIPQTIAGDWAEPIQVLKDRLGSRPKLG